MSTVIHENGKMTRCCIHENATAKYVPGKYPVVADTLSRAAIDFNLNNDILDEVEGYVHSLI